MVFPVEFAALLLAAVASAQTFTDCDPLKSTCAPDKAMAAKFSTDFGSVNSLPAGWHNVPCAGKFNYGKSGSTEMVIGGKGDCPTIETDDYVFFGLFEVKMRAAPGKGVVSSIVMQSDVRDEVDWEFLGGEDFRVQSNYFGKADTTTYDRMVYVPVTDPQNQFHTYGVNWTSASITWLVDGAPVRTLNYGDAQGGSRFPQTPMRFRLGSWVGGDPTLNGKGTVDWAGGEPDYSKVPFNMYIESVNIVNYSPASQYKYKDNSGSWQSIDIVGGSAGGIEDPSKNPQSSTPLSTSGVSTGSRIPPLPIATDKAGTTSSVEASTSSAAPSVHTDAVQSNGTVATGLPKPASTASSKPSQASANAAAGFSGMREMAGLSLFSALFFALYN